MDFEQNGSCDQKMLLLNYFKVYIKNVTSQIFQSLYKNVTTQIFQSLYNFVSTLGYHSAAMVTANHFFNQHQQYYFNNILSNHQINNESQEPIIKSEQNYFDSTVVMQNAELPLSSNSTTGSTSPVLQEIKAHGFTRSELAQVTLKKPRSTFTSQQVLHLEQEFKAQSYLCRPNRAKLASQLGLSERQVKIWFQNRRMKAKKLASKAPKIQNRSPLS